jgi:eukaryotic-like serine/threonine-protein kinase
MITPNIRLARPLGGGGMGSVWVAEHRGLGTQVVIKVISEQFALHADAHERFRREAAAASVVKSPHVVHVMDFGITTDGRPYIAMEMLEGEDLAKRLSRDGTLTPKKLSSIVTQVARALSRAHDKGVIHRDIKPENIFLTDVGTDDAFVKVLDFGIAKAMTGPVSTGTATGAMLGTPYYMSPEQVMGRRDVDPRADIWSLGVVAFEALTGKRPFDGDTVGAISIAICHGDMPTPSALRPDLPPAIDEWFKKACARDREQRFATAKDLAQAFESAAGGSDKVSIRPPGPSPDWSGELPAIPVTNEVALAGTMTDAPATTTKPDEAPSTIPAPKSVRKRASLALPIALAAVGVMGLIGGLVAFRMAQTPAPAAAAPQPPPPVEKEAVKPSATPTPIKPIELPPLEPVATASASTKSSATTTPIFTKKFPPIVPSAGPPAMGKMIISASGGWCNAAIDGKSQGPTPTGFVEVSAGQHVVSCVPPGGAAQKQSAVVNANETTRVKFQLP